MTLKPIVAAIGGVDSSGAAGLAVDIQAASSMGAHTAPIVTALTSQTLTDVIHVDCVDPASISSQLGALGSLDSLRGFKIGMLGTGKIVKVVAKHLRSSKCPIVLDPVLFASAGRALLDPEGVKVLRRELLPIVTLLTPNIPEAEVLTGHVISSRDDMRKAAYQLREMGAHAVVIKGGHASEQTADDFVADDKGAFWLSSARLPKAVRGTGCAFASIAAAALASGHEVRDALVMAKGYLSRGISRSYSICDERPQILFHDSWPPDYQDFPIVAFGVGPEDQLGHFPQITPDSIGFYPIVPRSSWIRPLAALGVKTIQLRIKDLSGALLEREIADGIAEAKLYGVQLFINDYWDLALKYGAFGVHLGQEDLVSIDIKRLRSTNIRLGISTHSHFEAAVAHGVKPSYVALGPIFHTTCKSMRFGPQGFERVKEWRGMLPYPIVAIGGLRPDHTPELKTHGAAGFAVISDWLHHLNPMNRVKEWLLSTI